MKIRKAIVSDLVGIQQLIEPFVKAYILLNRSEEQILSQIEQTFVCVYENKIIGVMNFVEFPKQLFEVRGLAIDKRFHSKGVGKQLVSFAIDELVSLQRSKKNKLADENKFYKIRLFALTYIPQFFIRLGFHVVEKEIYPEKIFEDCRLCEKNNDCHEVALEKTIELK